MDPLLLRFFERIIVVLFGGMAIYLGFRLFLVVPEHKDSTGKFKLPWDISIVMTRVGPGVFFALFGVAAVSLSLVQPLKIDLQGLALSGGEGKYQVSYMGEKTIDDRTARADARALLRKEIAVLNTIPQLLRSDLPKYEQDSIKRGIARVKLMLMKPVWGDNEEGFGDFSSFERWVQDGELGSAPPGMDGASALYNYGLRETVP